MIICKKCKCPVMLDISNAVKLLTSYSFTDKGLKVNIGDMFVKDTAGESKFYCTNCKEDLTADQVELICMQCGGVITDNAFRPTKAGGIYCKKDVDDYFPEGSKKVVFRKFFFLKREDKRRE